MKQKILLAVVFLLAAGTLAGCKDSGSSPSKGENEVAVTSSSAETEQQTDQKGTEEQEETVSTDSDTGPVETQDVSEEVEASSGPDIVEDYVVELEEDETAVFQ